MATETTPQTRHRYFPFSLISKSKNETSRDAAYRHVLYFKDLSKNSAEGVIRHLQSSPQGLGAEQVKEKLMRFGANNVTQEKAVTWYSQLLKAFISPFILLLSALAII